MGTSYQAKDDLDSAIKFFNKSLTEHRTPDILEKLRLVEKTKKDRDVAAYIDPAKAEEARNAGNELFKKGDFVGAVRNYSEAIKRLPCVPRTPPVCTGLSADPPSPRLRLQFRPQVVQQPRLCVGLCCCVWRSRRKDLSLTACRALNPPPSSRLHQARRAARGPQGRQHGHLA